MSDIEKAIQEIEDMACHSSLKTNITTQSMCVILEALREKLEREKGCGICNTAEIDKLLIRNFQRENELCFRCGNSGFPKESYARFCPKCGRKLVEK